MRKKQKRVLLAFGWYDHHVHQGIAKYAQEHGWHLCPDVTREKLIPWGWEGDGILAWLGAGDDLAEFVVAARKPTVDFSFRRPHLPFPRVLMDHAATARLVAEHFHSRGFNHFMCYSDVDNWSFEERARGYVAAVKELGHDCVWLCWHRAREFRGGRYQWQNKRRWLAAQLKQAPKPLAVFAVNDDNAVEILETCEGLGLAVPEQVSIFGADNSLPAVEGMRTPLSSVDTNMGLLGYRGAALLGDLMRGKRAPKEPIRIPPAGLIERKSSDLLALNHPGVGRSLRFIWEHCHEPIGVADLARVSGMSRSGLHHAYLEHIGRPPGTELHRVRIERAKKLLTQADWKMNVIARMCGYQSANSFWVAFKQATGVSPKKYHEQFGI
jgi:LacI family transcriptional regulator